MLFAYQNQKTVKIAFIGIFIYHKYKNDFCYYLKKTRFIDSKNSQMTNFCIFNAKLTILIHLVVKELYFYFLFNTNSYLNL
jgi:hypothetical protein